LFPPVSPVRAAQTPTASTTAPAAPAKSHPTTKKKSATSTRRQTTPDPARIREIQQALTREGFHEVEPTGKWDEPSINAMKQFQQAKGLNPTGKIEAVSLQKLGLGSPVAGMAAPDPQTPASVPSSSPPSRP
jgi:peptidoglycan hydrolase-like protein with peptidoglycan-binding domain